MACTLHHKKPVSTFCLKKMQDSLSIKDSGFYLAFIKLSHSYLDENTASASSIFNVHASHALYVIDK